MQRARGRRALDDELSMAQMQSGKLWRRTNFTAASLLLNILFPPSGGAEEGILSDKRGASDEKRAQVPQQVGEEATQGIWKKSSYEVQIDTVLLCY